MRKYTRKELKNMVALGMAEDVTRANNEDYERIIKKEGFLSQVGYSSGVYPNTEFGDWKELQIRGVSKGVCFSDEEAYPDEPLICVTMELR